MTYAVDFPPEEFPPEPPPAEYDYEPPDDVHFWSEPPETYDYAPEPFLTAAAPDQQALPGLEPLLTEPPSEWSWMDARFVGLEQFDPAGQLTGYEVGCVDLYANVETGDLGGTFLQVQTFGSDQLEQAEDLFNRLNGYAYDKDLAAYELPDLAEKAAAKIARREGLEVSSWRGLTPDEYTMFGRELGFVQDIDPDMPPEYVQDDLLRAAYDLSGVAVDVEAAEPAARALTGIGLAAEDFDPDRDVPPFYDETTQTAYWIGIYQPDPDDRDTCVASILSLTRDPDTGSYEAQLAPCVAGNWEKAYQSSEHLIGIAQRSDDIERVFEAAEGMAIAADQHDTWQKDRGVPLEPESARDIADYAVQTWEMNL
jgi:hypothetical protein